jgi:hypothetical protein
LRSSPRSAARIDHEADRALGVAIRTALEFTPPIWECKRFALPPFRFELITVRNALRSVP